jgi:hypothetical protein
MPGERKSPIAGAAPMTRLKASAETQKPSGTRIPFEPVDLLEAKRIRTQLFISLPERSADFSSRDRPTIWRCR